MKTIKLILILITSFLMADLSGQSKKLFLDTVNIDCSDHVRVIIATYNHMDLKKDTTLTAHIFNLQKIMKKLEDNVPENFYRIIFKPNYSVIMEKVPPVTNYMVRGDSIIPFRQKNICEMKTSEYDLYIYFEDIQGLLDPEIAHCVIETVHSLPGKSRFAWSYNYKYINGTKSIESLQPKKTNGWDMLNITPGIGVGLVPERLMLDVSLEVGFNFSKKGVIKNSFYLSDEFVVFSDGYDFQSSINDFVNIGYRYNLSNHPDKNNWLGTEIGVAVLRKSSNPFSDNLFRVGIKWDIGKSFWVSGYLYVNKYNSLDPGIKIGFGF